MGRGRAGRVGRRPVQPDSDRLVRRSTRRVGPTGAALAEGDAGGASESHRLACPCGTAAATAMFKFFGGGLRGEFESLSRTILTRRGRCDEVGRARPARAALNRRDLGGRRWRSGKRTGVPGLRPPPAARRERTPRGALREAGPAASRLLWEERAFHRAWVCVWGGVGGGTLLVTDADSAGEAGSLGGSAESARTCRSAFARKVRARGIACVFVRAVLVVV